MSPTAPGVAPTITSIHTSPATRLPMREVEAVDAEAGVGLVGDRYHGSRHRHVTIQSQEALAVAAANLGRDIPPASTRRNLTISHGEIPTSPGSNITIGLVRLEVVRIAAPCKLLEDVIGPGAKDALRRRAGSVCRILNSGTVAVGDVVDLSS